MTRLRDLIVLYVLLGALAAFWLFVAWQSGVVRWLVGA